MLAVHVSPMSPRTDRDRTDSHPCRRRTVLATLAASTLGALAGCNDGGSDGTTDPTPSPSPSPSPAATTAPPTTDGQTRSPTTDDATDPETPALPDGEWELPEYVDRSAFREVDLAIERDGCSLPARLSVPRGDGPFPAAVIVHGSGPQNMDGSIRSIRPYRDLAWGLASRGVGVLRYDKVTAVCPRAVSPATLDTVTVDDAVGAVALVRDWAGTPQRRSVTDLTVVGHSLGGAALPRIVDRADGADRGVALAGNARPMYVAIVDQIRQSQRADDQLSERENETYDRLQDGLDRIEAGEYEAAAEVFGAYGLTAPFVRSIDQYDRFATARETAAPLTFAQGRGDIQVTVEDDFERWQAELDGRPDTRFELYDGLNHNFTPEPTSFEEADYSTPSNVARPVVEDLATWAGAGDDAAV